MRGDTRDRDCVGLPGMSLGLLVGWVICCVISEVGDRARSGEHGELTKEVHFWTELFHLREKSSLKRLHKDTHHMDAHRQYCCWFCFTVLGFTQRHLNMHLTKKVLQSEPGSQFVSLEELNYAHYVQDK